MRVPGLGRGGGKDKSRGRKQMDKEERLFFIAATFGKYMEYYGSRNEYMFDEEMLNEDVMPSLEGELVDWFKQSPLKREEVDHIIHYMHVINERMFEIDELEKNR